MNYAYAEFRYVKGELFRRKIILTGGPIVEAKQSWEGNVQ